MQRSHLHTNIHAFTHTHTHTHAHTHIQTYIRTHIPLLTLTSFAALSIYSSAVVTDAGKDPESASMPPSRARAASTQPFNFCFCKVVRIE